MEFETALLYDVRKQISLFEKIIAKDMNNQNAHNNLEKLKFALKKDPTITIAFDVSLDYDKIHSQIKW